MTEETACTLKKATDKMLETSVKTEMVKHQEKRTRPFFKMLKTSEQKKKKKKGMELSFAVHLIETF